VAGSGRDAPWVQFDTVLGDTDAIFAMSVAFNPPRLFKSTTILAIVLVCISVCPPEAC